jgi:hypothetical protein
MDIEKLSDYLVSDDQSVWHISVSLMIDAIEQMIIKPSTKDSENVLSHKLLSQFQYLFKQ